MHTPIDLVLVLVIAVLWVAYEHFIAWPRFVRRIASGVPGGRIRGYQIVLATEWGLSALAVWAWSAQRHPWSALLLAPPAGVRLWVPAGLCAALAAAMAFQVVAIARRPARPRLRAQLEGLVTLLPHDARELAWFCALSVTAGLCEEWLFRGIVTTVLASAIGLPAAVLLCNVSFGLAHAYQGRSGIVKTGVVGLVMSAVVILTGSLLPAMLLHVIVDLGSGLTAYVVFTKPSAEAAAPAA